MRKMVVPDGIFKRRCNSLLTDNGIKRHRAVLAGGYNKIFHG
jgi:hypothetical protein